MVEGQQQEGFNQLRLNGRRPDGNDRLLREDGGSFGNRPDVTGKAEVPEIVQKGFRKESFAPEVIQILLTEMQIQNVVDDPIQTGADGVAAVIRDIPEENVKVGDAILKPCFKVAVAHGQLIEIAEHGHVEFICHIHCAVSFSPVPQNAARYLYYSLLTL